MNWIIIEKIQSDEQDINLKDLPIVSHHCEICGYKTKTVGEDFTYVRDEESGKTKLACLLLIGMRLNKKIWTKR